MNKEEFYEKFDQTKIDDRVKLLDFNRLGIKTLVDVYEELRRIDEQIEPLEERQNYLLEIIKDFI